MLFNTVQFAIFFAVVLALFRAVPRGRGLPVLLGASLVFYSLWYPAYLLLMLSAIAVNYGLLRLIARPGRPRWPLIASIVFTLGMLGIFKYAGMALESAAPILRAVVDPPLQVPDLFLPLGISFYSFQIIAFAVDTWRGKVEEIPGPFRYALFISFFPQLIAGPILRGAQLLPQLARGGEPTPERSRRGLWLIASGLAKKVILADFLLAPFVNDVYANPGLGGSAFHLIALYSFAFQIYFDFSGYTDMARGIALLLGFELPFNFLEPYLSRCPAEFWRRWHITLSQWLRDYLYISLGGNRVGKARTYVNLMLTMLLGGLWHGAAWTFVAWGALHGLLLVLDRRFGRGHDGESDHITRGDALRILLVFHATCLIWVFFRAPTFSDALAMLHIISSGPIIPVYLPSSILY